MEPNHDEGTLQEDMKQMEEEGWTLQQDGCSSGSAYDFAACAILEGEIKSVRSIKVRRGGEMVKARLMTLMSDDGFSTVWESAALAGLFDVAKVGDEVRIEYLGEVEMPPPKSPMKDYRVWVRPHDEG